MSNAQRKTAGLHWGRANSLLHSDGGRAASVGEERALKREGQAREKGGETHSDPGCAFMGWPGRWSWAVAADSI